jgi:hypothetical protein|tara:strand:- start:1343 stop:2848 length:1506 start_codon:yes stop_codon:yes gene_type:complete
MQIFIVLIIFINDLLQSLISGGRWDLNEQIAVGINLFNNLPTFSNGANDLFQVSSPYFPGIGIIAGALNFLIADIYYLNQIMIFLASIIGLFLLLMISKITDILYPQISKSHKYFVIILIYLFNLQYYSAYMMEFKPDSILLIFILGIFFILNSAKPKKSIYFILPILLFVASFLKQSAFIAYIFTVTHIFFTKTLSKSIKSVLIFLSIFTGFLSLIIMNNIENLFFYTVEVMGEHDFLPLIDFTKYFIKSFYKNIIVMIGLMLFLYKSFIYKNTFFEKITNVRVSYYFLSLVWFLFSLLSMAKVGGNEGNFEAGVILLIPMVLNGYSYFFTDLVKNINTKHFSFFYVVVVTVSLLNIYEKSVLLKDKYIDDKNIIHYLKTNYKNSISFTDGNTFILARSADLNIITSAETINHFSQKRAFDFTSLKTALKERKFELIFLSQDLSYLSDTEINQLIFENYELIIFEDNLIKIPQNINLKSNLIDTRNFLLFKRKEYEKKTS